MKAEGSSPYTQNPLVDHIMRQLNSQLRFQDQQ
jgi:hypothetical protein